MSVKIDENGIKVDGVQKINFLDNYINFEKKNTDIVLFEKTSPSSFKVLSGLKLKVGTTDIVLDSDYVLSLDTNLDTGSKVAGTDYYVYAKSDSTFYISLDKTITDDRLIGGFHYGLTAENESVTGNKTEADMVAIRGINAYSFWDLKFRAVAGNEGMVLVGSKWYDIYLLNSEHIDNGTSKAGATISAGTTDYGRAIPKIPLEYGGNNSLTYGKLTWFQLCEIAKSHGKELIGYDEFPTIAYGVYEGKSSSTDGYETVAGKIEHYPELTSKFGIEQASGVQYVWGKDLSKREDGAGAWKDVLDGRGQMYSYGTYSQVAVLLGGYRVYGVYAGSRTSNWSNSVWYSSWDVGSRFACDHLKLV
jgi:hypothetical protein